MQTKTKAKLNQMLIETECQSKQNDNPNKMLYGRKCLFKQNAPFKQNANSNKMLTRTKCQLK